MEPAASTGVTVLSRRAPAGLAVVRNQRTGCRDSRAARAARGELGFVVVNGHQQSQNQCSRPPVEITDNGGMSRTAQIAPATRARGVQRIWDPRVWGTTIGAAGATVFVMTSRGVLADPWPVVAVVVWAVAMLAYITFVFATRRTFAEIRMVGAKGGFVYLGSVAGMLLLIRLGTMVLDNANETELRPALIVMAVGLHFLPFAAAFHTPMFTVLGAIMAVLGCAGLALGWVWDEQAAAAIAVISGVVMLTVIASDAARAARQPQHSPDV